jgi:hypothetical protein
MGLCLHPACLGLGVKARSDFISILAASHNVVVILLYHSIPSDEINMHTSLLVLVFVSYLSPKGWRHFRWYHSHKAGRNS